MDFFSATSSDEKVNRAYITGGVSKTEGILETLQQRLGIPVHALDPFKEIYVDEKNFDSEYVREVGPFFSVAVGLALRKVGDK